MRASFIGCGLFAAGLLWASIANAQNPFSTNPFKVPDEFAEQLQDYRTQWSRMTGFEYSGLHWQQFIVVYLNQSADVYRNNYNQYVKFYQDFDDFEEDQEEPAFKTYTPGTIVLKENFGGQSGSPDTPLSVTMMIKREAGYDPKNGDWEYVQYAPNGSIIMRGNTKNRTVQGACAGCHVNMKERDYIFSNFFSKPE